MSSLRRTIRQDPGFLGRLMQAESSFEVFYLRNIHQASKKNWRAAAWVLERIMPDRFVPRTPGTLTAEQMTQVISQFANLVADEVPEEERRKAILRRMKEVRRTLADMRRANQRPRRRSS